MLFLKSLDCFLLEVRLVSEVGFLFGVWAVVVIPFLIIWHRVESTSEEMVSLTVEMLILSLVGFDLSIVSLISGFEVRILLVKLELSRSYVGFVFVVDKSFVRHRYLLTSVKRCLLSVSA